MHSTKNFIKGFDIFSKQFVFFVGDKRSKSTLIGGTLSLSIGIVSAIYFYYLINMYFSGSVEPKTTSSILIEAQENSISIFENFFMFEMLIKGVPLNQYEQQVGKKFLTYHVYYEQYDSAGGYVQVEIPLIQCTDQDFLGFLCMDEKALNNKNIYNQPIKKISSNYAIIVEPCDQTVNDNCATDQEFQDTILKTSNYFQIYTKIKQYNNSERAYRDSYKSDFFYFDPNLIVYTRMNLIKATTTVTEGIVIQSSQVIESIFDFKRLDTYFSQEDIYERMEISGFAYIVFDLSQVHNLITIQHAMITEILAQFMSIFNSLLIIGILARIFAESRIVEDMNIILLKQYYKKTALRLLNHYDQKQLQQQQTKESQKIKQKDNSDRSHRIYSEEKDPLQEIISKQNKLNQANFTDQKQNYFQMSTFERAKIFFGQIFRKKLKEQGQSDQGPDTIIYRKIQNQSNKRINIFEVYKDLIQLKMAIKLILTKEQFAALQFCGSEICVQDPADCTDYTENEQKLDKFNKDQTGSQSLKKAIISQKASSKHFNAISQFFKKSKEVKFTQEKKDKGISKDICSKEFISQHLSDINLFTDYHAVENSNQKNIKNDQCESSQQNTNQLLYQHGMKYKENKIDSIKIQGDIDKIEDCNMSDNLECTITVKPHSIQSELIIHDQTISEIQQKSHLVEMDKIEDNYSYQQKYLKLFLNKIERNNSDLNHIDRNIFESLPFDQNIIQQRHHSTLFQNNFQHTKSCFINSEVNPAQLISQQTQRDELDPIQLNIDKNI